jgi:hypothetical protein
MPPPSGKDDPTNPYARPTVWGRLPQEPFRIGATPKTGAERPVALQRPPGAGILGSSPLMPGRPAAPREQGTPPPPEPGPAEAPITVQAAPVVAEPPPPPDAPEILSRLAALDLERPPRRPFPVTATIIGVAVVVVIVGAVIMARRTAEVPDPVPAVAASTTAVPSVAAPVAAGDGAAVPETAPIYSLPPPEALEPPPTTGGATPPSRAVATGAPEPSPTVTAPVATPPVAAPVTPPPVATPPPVVRRPPPAPVSAQPPDDPDAPIVLRKGEE